jgi:hypothetical protein
MKRTKCVAFLALVTPLIAVACGGEPGSADSSNHAENADPIRFCLIHSGDVANPASVDLGELSPASRPTKSFSVELVPPAGGGGFANTVTASFADKSGRWVVDSMTAWHWQMRSTGWPTKVTDVSAKGATLTNVPLGDRIDVALHFTPLGSADVADLRTTLTVGDCGSSTQVPVHVDTRPAVSVGVSQGRTGPLICVNGTAFTPNAYANVAFYGIPGKNGPWDGASEPTENGTFKIVDTSQESFGLTFCTGNQVQANVDVQVTDSATGAVAHASVPAGYWCTNAYVPTNFNGGCN